MNEFDPHAHAREVREHPERFVTFASIFADAMALRSVNAAPDLHALNKAFQAPAKVAKKAGDAVLLKMLTEASAARKMVLAPKEAA